MQNPLVENPCSVDVQAGASRRSICPGNTYRRSRNPDSGSEAGAEGNGLKRGRQRELHPGWTIDSWNEQASRKGVSRAGINPFVASTTENTVGSGQHREGGAMRCTLTVQYRAAFGSIAITTAVAVRHALSRSGHPLIRGPQGCKGGRLHWQQRQHDRQEQRQGSEEPATHSAGMIRAGFCLFKRNRSAGAGLKSSERCSTTRYGFNPAPVSAIVVIVKKGTKQ